MIVESVKVFSRCKTALMMPCDAKGVSGLDALVAKGEQVINAGMKSVVYCGSMSDWPLLSDEQRQEGVSALIDARIPVIVGTGAQNTLKAQLDKLSEIQNEFAEKQFNLFNECWKNWD